jgi:hypothetical protein
VEEPPRARDSSRVGWHLVAAAFATVTLRIAIWRRRVLSATHHPKPPPRGGTHGKLTTARLPFSARHARVASAAASNVSSVFRFLSPRPCISMSSPTFWSDACRNAVGRPLQAQLNAVYASCGVTVRVRQPLLQPLGACPAHACVAGCLVCL